MYQKGKQEQIMASSATLPVVIIVCLIAYFVHSIICPATPVEDSFILLPTWNTIKLPVWLNHICSLSTYILSVYLFVELNNHSDILRTQNPPLIVDAIFEKTNEIREEFKIPSRYGESEIIQGAVISV